MCNGGAHSSSRSPLGCFDVSMQERFNFQRGLHNTPEGLARVHFRTLHIPDPPAKREVK